MWPGNGGRSAAPAPGGAATSAASSATATSASSSAAAAAAAAAEESIVPTLCCCICTELFEQPMVVSCCGNSFCQKCLDTALAHSDACPMCRAPLIGGIDQVFPNRALAQLVEQARIIGVTRQQRLAMSAVAAALPASHVANTSAPQDFSQEQAQRDTHAQAHVQAHAHVQAQAQAHVQSNAGTRVNAHSPSLSQANLARETSAHTHAVAAAAGGGNAISSAGSFTVSSSSGSSTSSSNDHYRSSLQSSREIGPLTFQSTHSTVAGVTASSPSPYPHSPQPPSACAPSAEERQDHTAISIPDYTPSHLTSSTPFLHQSSQPNIQQSMEQILAQGQASQQRHEDLAGAERSGVDSIVPDLVVRLSGSGAAADRQSAQQQPGHQQQQQLPERLAQAPQVLSQEQRHQQRQQHRQHRHQQQQQQQQQQLRIQQLQQGRCCCPSPYVLAVRGLLACGSSGRRLLLLCARARRWFLVNEPRIRFSLFLAVSALLVFYLRVQEEEYARVTRYP